MKLYRANYENGQVVHQEHEVICIATQSYTIATTGANKHIPKTGNYCTQGTQKRAQGWI